MSRSLPLTDLIFFVKGLDEYFERRSQLSFRYLSILAKQRAKENFHFWRESLIGGVKGERSSLYMTHASRVFCLFLCFSFKRMSTGYAAQRQVGVACKLLLRFVLAPLFSPWVWQFFREDCDSWTSSWITVLAKSTYEQTRYPVGRRSNCLRPHLRATQNVDGSMR